MAAPFAEKQLSEAAQLLLVPHEYDGAVGRAIEIRRLRKRRPRGGGDGARVVRAPTPCLRKGAGEEGLAARMLLVRSGRQGLDHGHAYSAQQ